MERSLTPADAALLEAAYEQAVRSREEGGVPIGAALGTRDGRVLARGHNRREQNGDTTAHAEIECLRAAGRRRDWGQLVLASTLSPCVMCAGAAVLHRVGRVVVGERRTFVGAEGLLRSGGAEVVLADDPRCVALMERFKREHAELWDEDIGVPPNGASDGGVR